MCDVADSNVIDNVGGLTYRCGVVSWGVIVVRHFARKFFKRLDQVVWKGTFAPLFLYSLQSIHGVDFRQSIFIFLSNTGGYQLSKKVLEAWQDGRKREEITYQELEELIQVPNFSKRCGIT
jgi:hypothetical protein